MKAKNVIDIFENRNDSQSRLEEFKNNKEMEVELTNGNVIKYPFNVQKIIEIFEKKLAEGIKNSSIIYTDKDWEYTSLYEDEKMEAISQLDNIYAFKYFGLKLECAIEYNMRKPQSEIEELEYEIVVRNKVKKFFGNKIEENMAQILANTWLKDIENNLSQEHY